MIRQVRAHDWQRLRDARLRALTEAPYAFASNLASEQAFEDGVWQRRATPSETSASFAEDRQGRFDAIVSCFVADDPTTVHLVAMWVAPERRGRGLGSRLVNAIVEWARAHDAERVCLCVEAGNASALTLYERCGFRRTNPAPKLPYQPGAGADVLVLEL